MSDTNIQPAIARKTKPSLSIFWWMLLFASFQALGKPLHWLTGTSVKGSCCTAISGCGTGICETERRWEPSDSRPFVWEAAPEMGIQPPKTDFTPSPVEPVSPD